jgi:pyrroline-5-carboxylate reductase
MGMAFAKSFLQYDLVKKENLLLVEKNKERMEALRDFNTGVVTGIIDASLGNYDLLILAVKPQDFASVHPSLREVIQPSQIVLSIMAGISMDLLRQTLHHPLIIRAMPNTPALLGMGMTAFAASPDIEVSQLRKVENLINATGRSVFLEEEALLDAVTALSGSGPAYFFYIVKSMIEAGKQMGFEESLATLLVKQTMLGSFHLINNAEKSLDELVNAVASKGGTTEAALKQFKEGKLSETLIQGIRAAEERAKELSKS